MPGLEMMMVLLSYFSDNSVVIFLIMMVTNWGQCLSCAIICPCGVGYNGVNDRSAYHRVPHTTGCPAEQSLKLAFQTTRPRLWV